MPTLTDIAIACLIAYFIISAVIIGRHVYHYVRDSNAAHVIAAAFLILQREGDVIFVNWDWPKRIAPFGQGTYVFRDGDWVRP